MSDFIEIRSPEKIKNLNIAGIAHWIDRFIVQISTCQSAGQSKLVTDDLDRWKSYVSYLKKDIETYGGIKLDLPAFHPTETRVPTPPQISAVDNRRCMEVIRFLIAMRVELTFSQSAGIAAGINSDDRKRIDTLTTALDTLLERYEDPAPDLPDRPDDGGGQ